MNRRLQLFTILVSVAACSANAGGGAKADLTTDEAKTFYALGMSVGQNMGRNGAFANLTPAQVEDIREGMSDGLTGKTAQVDMPTYGPKIQEMMKARMGVANQAEAAKAVDEKKKGAAYEETAAKAPGATKLPSGLVYRTITPGTGATPTAADTVKVNYEGKLIDGTVFDASDKHGGAATFPLAHVVPCWTEGVGHMKVGEKAELVCPSAIAYGDTGHPPVIPGGATLDFTVELLEINPKPVPGAPGMGGAMGGPASHAMGGPGAPHMMPGGKMMMPPPRPMTPPPPPKSAN